MIKHNSHRSLHHITARDVTEPDAGWPKNSPSVRPAASRRHSRWPGLVSSRHCPSFDFAFQPSLDRNRILALAQLDFIDRREVVHLIGQSGTGKSHLAVALGVEAVRAGRSVYFSPLADIIDSLARADREGRLANASAMSVALSCSSSMSRHLSVGASAGNCSPSWSTPATRRAP